MPALCCACKGISIILLGRNHWGPQDLCDVILGGNRCVAVHVIPKQVCGGCVSAEGGWLILPQVEKTPWLDSASYVHSGSLSAQHLATDENLEGRWVPSQPARKAPSKCSCPWNSCARYWKGLVKTPQKFRGPVGNMYLTQRALDMTLKKSLWVCSFLKN